MGVQLSNQEGSVKGKDGFGYDCHSGSPHAGHAAMGKYLWMQILYSDLAGDLLHLVMMGDQQVA